MRVSIILTAVLFNFVFLNGQQGGVQTPQDATVEQQIGTAKTIDTLTPAEQVQAVEPGAVSAEQAKDQPSPDIQKVEVPAEQKQEVKPGAVSAEQAKEQPSPDIQKVEVPAEQAQAVEPGAVPAEQAKEQPLPDIQKVEVTEPEKAGITEQEAPKEEPIGIDTVSVEEPQGNWLFKRIWWERAEERYEKIRTSVDKIWESRMSFFIKRNELEKKVLEPFYRSVNMGQGELLVILSDIIAHSEKEREERGMLSDQEREMQSGIEVEQEALKQLKLDVEAIASLDQAIDDALITFMDQINNARKFEREAWGQFKEIARVLSDNKARELFYAMDGAWRNIKSINTYLEKDFTDHFTKLIQEVEKQVARVQAQIQALKEKGIDFKKQADLLVQQEELEKTQQLSEQEEEEVKPKPKRGWLGWTYDKITSGIYGVWDFVTVIIRMPFDLIFGTNK